jgi:hypothetical protein
MAIEMLSGMSLLIANDCLKGILMDDCETSRQIGCMPAGRPPGIRTVTVNDGRTAT